MRRLSPETQTLYAELMEQVTAIEARRSIGNLKGCFTTKEVKGEDYCYFQYSDLNGVARQVYIGRQSPALSKLIKKIKEEKNLIKTDVPDTLEKLELGFLPVPALNHKNPSTSFKVRGSTLMVDILTPASKESEKPVFISHLNTSAQPLPFLDYLIEGFEKGAIVNSEGILVNVPSPARFAFHKLIISQERSIAMHSKSEKDIAQAANIFAVLADDRPGDLIIALEDIKKRSKRWIVGLKKGLGILKTKFPVEYEKLLSAVPLVAEK